MNLIEYSIRRPVAVMAAVLMVIMFGAVALITIPIQLTPDVRRPVISIQTVWPGAAPAEIEREIVNRQEDELKGLEGLEKITSRSQDGRARINLEFNINQNMDKALLLVANRLDRVTGYPDEADEPTFKTSTTEDNPTPGSCCAGLRATTGTSTVTATSSKTSSRTAWNGCPASRAPMSTAAASGNCR